MTDDSFPETSPNTLHTLTIEALASDGRGVARLDGMTVFVEDVLPGQVVRVRLSARKKRFAEAEVMDIITRAPAERAPACPHAEVCGGCPWQTLPYAQQLLWKQRTVTEALRRIGGVGTPLVSSILPSPAEWGYRNKMAFAFGEDRAGKLTLGQRRRRSHLVVNVTGCLMQDTLSMRVLAAVRAFALDSGLPPKTDLRPNGYWRHTVIRRPRSGQCLVEVLTAAHPGGPAAALALGQALATALREAVPEVSGVAVTLRADPADIAQGESTVFSSGTVTLSEILLRPATATQNGRFPALSLSFDHRSFFQVNTPAMEMLYAEAARLLAKAPVGYLWDLYCGVGGIGLFLAPLAKAVHGVECVAPAVRQARLNAAQARFTHCGFTIGDAAQAFARMDKTQVGADTVVVVDPPRAGLSAPIIEGLLLRQPGRVLYISCNPATLARDVARLAPAYTLAAAQPVDLFPQTPHVETAALLSKI